MNCLFETVASMWMVTLRTVKPNRQDIDDEAVQENLEGCRMSLEVRESALSESCKKLGREAIRRKQQGDTAGAKTKLLERRRSLKRLEKLRNSLALVDAQLDALKNTELDRELMQTLMASSAALKKAGIEKGVEEARTVMTELDEQLRDSSELTSVLSSNIQDDAEFDLEEEFEALMTEEAEEVKTSTPAIVNKIDTDHRLIPSSVSVPDVPAREEVTYASVVASPWNNRQQQHQQQFVRAL